MERRARSLRMLALAPLAALLTAIAPVDSIAGCAWGPVRDAAAVQTTLEKWTTAINLPPFGQPPWDFSIDGDRARLLLRFVKGTLTLAWQLDDTCAPTAISVQASIDYEGPRPDTAAVKRLEQSLRTLTVEAHSEPGPSRAYALLGRVFYGVAAAGLLAAGVGVIGAIWRMRISLGAVFGWVAANARAASARLALVLLGLVLATAVAEVAARLTHVDDRLLAASLFYVMGDEPSEHRASRDPFLHYELNPGARVTHHHPADHAYTVTIDEFGARLPTHRRAKPPGTFRILCFGGSTLFGAAVNDSETIPAAMERKLDETGTDPMAGRIEVWNFGTSAYNLAQATHLARTRLALLAPDLVLVQIHNVFPRPFFRLGSDDPAELMRTMERIDPYLDDEQFPVPAWLNPAVHRFAIRHSAAYRAGMGLFRRLDRSPPEFSTRLGQDEARSLVREAAARDVPVIFVAIPTDRGLGKDVAVYPGLPEGQFIDLYRPGREPDFYEVHPPPRILDEYAGLLVDELRARRLVPPRRGGSSPPRTATVEPERGVP
jgi:hypothetical protein